MVGCVDMSSEGGGEVDGVSRFGGWRSGSSMGGGGSVADIVVSSTLSTSATSWREGNSTGAFEDCGAGILLLRRGALGGKVPSNDCQGRGG